ncbi:MAG: cytochrome P450, partial [Paracoccaceae bacterium]
SLDRSQWDMLKADPSLIPAAINEALRMDAPIRSFSRYVREDANLGEVELKAGDRLIVLYGSANRDERHYDDPDRFDITRNNRDQLAFGYGLHTCGGMHLARLEMTALLEAMLEKIDHFETSDPVIEMNNTLRGFESLQMRVHAAAS